MLFLLFCCQQMRHKLCTQFSFFQIIRQNAVNDGFQYPVLSAIILQLAWQSSFKTAATRAIFSFVFIVPSLSFPLCSVSSVDSSHATNRLCHRNTIARKMDESPKSFYKHFPHFCSYKSRFTTLFNRGTFKIFFHGNL